MCADFSKEEVCVKQLGSHPSRVANRSLKKDETYLLGPMGWLELVEGKYKYHVYFGNRMLAANTLQTSETDTDQPPPTVSISGITANLEGNSQLENPTPSKKFKADSGTVQTTLQFASGESSAGASSVSDLELKSWTDKETLLVYRHGPVFHSDKVAAFDVDYTIIETASGKKFPTGPTDWKFMSQTQSKLKSLVEEGFRIVLITNQLGISKGRPTKAEFKQKVEAIASQLRIPLILMASTTKDSYRKPCTGMWDHLRLHENGQVEVDLKSSFYVGDAAGREVGWMPGMYMCLLYQNLVFM